MSHSGLGRSIIECGRRASSQFNRRLRVRGLRRWKVDEEGEYLPERPRGEKEELSDRLAPLHRWLLRQVGRSWADIYSEFCAREDIRSLRGDHIHRHLKQMVRGARTREYFVRYDPDRDPPCAAQHGAVPYNTTYPMLWIDRGTLRCHRRADCEKYARLVGWKPKPLPALPEKVWRYASPAPKKRELTAAELDQILKQHNRVMRAEKIRQRIARREAQL